MNNLNLDKSIAAILDAAQRAKFISYGDVAKANGIEWSFAMNRLMPKHLDMILAKSDAKGWPLITSIVVNKPNILSGKLEDTALMGFISGAKGLGYEVAEADRQVFLEEQQRETFAFGLAYGAGK
ncbi:hypothetical protein BH09PSE1_BH09PSE1_11310 [soil metagenome]